MRRMPQVVSRRVIRLQGAGQAICSHSPCGCASFVLSVARMRTAAATLHLPDTQEFAQGNRGGAVAAVCRADRKQRAPVGEERTVQVSRRGEVMAERLRLPRDRERCVLVSFGGLGKSYDPALLRRWPEHVLIGPDPALAAEPNGRVLPEGVRPLDLMPLCSRLITKPGYSSFCEAFSQGLGIHLVRRRGFAEAPILEEIGRAHV